MPDIRVSTDDLSDPVMCRLSSEAVAALIYLKLWSMKLGTDGRIAANLLIASGTWPGIPRLTPQARDELVAADLVKVSKNGDLTVSWEGQTSSADMVRIRQKSRESSQRNRDKQKAAHQAHSVE